MRILCGISSKYLPQNAIFLVRIFTGNYSVQRIIREPIADRELSVAKHRFVHRTGTHNIQSY